MMVEKSTEGGKRKRGRPPKSSDQSDLDWSRISDDCMQLLCCLSDVPQPLEWIADDCGMESGRAGECIHEAKSMGWRIRGSAVKGYVLSASPPQVDLLEAFFDRQVSGM